MMPLPAPIVWNRKPLPQNLLAPLPPTAIRPGGEMRVRIEARTPDALDGQLIRACLLRDTTAQDAAQAQIAALLTDGPRTDADVRALMTYHAVTADKAAATALLRYAKALRDMLTDGEALPARRAADIGDLLHMSLWLYNLTGQRVLLDLCELLAAQAPDWMSTLHIFPQTRAVADAPDPETDAYWRVHGATIAASLKTPAMQALFAGGLKNETAFAVGWEKLTRRHGAAHGLFAADPLLAGPNPSRMMDAGVPEAIIRAMPALLWAQGDPACGDLFERTAYGPLAAAHGPQAANQLLPGEGDPAEGWARLAAASWMATRDEGLAAIAYMPGEVRWRLHGQPVRVSVKTAYPYDETIRLTVRPREALSFPLRLRIPAWAEGAAARVGDEAFPCEPGTFAVIERIWQDGDEIVLTLPMAVQTIQRHRQSLSVERGPLIYALALEADTAWQVALLPDAGFEVGEAAGIPVIHASATDVPTWARSGDSPGELPIAPPVGAIRRITLIPYGQTRARIAQFPQGHAPSAE